MLAPPVAIAQGPTAGGGPELVRILGGDGDDRGGAEQVPAGGDFPQLEPGAELPSDEECAARVQRNPWEPRPENEEANTATPPGPVESRSWGNAQADTYKDRVTGNFTGTTDEVIQWASCKWGFETDITRAQAVQESTWVQSARGDGGVSYGLLQIKSTVWTGTLPWSRDSTAYNVDWSLGMRRACYEGHIHGDQGRGDLWGCIGSHYSGRWMDSGARRYNDRVRGHLDAMAWLDWDSAGGEPPTDGREVLDAAGDLVPPDDAGTEPGDAGDTGEEPGTEPGDAGDTGEEPGTEPGDAGDTGEEPERRPAPEQPPLDPSLCQDADDAADSDPAGDEGAGELVDDLTPALVGDDGGVVGGLEQLPPC